VQTTARRKYTNRREMKLKIGSMCLCEYDWLVTPNTFVNKQLRTLLSV
jgi:hypothetical protein